MDLIFDQNDELRLSPRDMLDIRLRDLAGHRLTKIGNTEVDWLIEHGRIFPDPLTSELMVELTVWMDAVMVELTFALDQPEPRLTITRAAD